MNETTPLPNADQALQSLDRLRADVDRESAALSHRHRSRLHCGRGCSACCSDDLTVFGVEAEQIRRSFPELLASGRPHPVGGCAFLDSEGACRIYSVRPLVCRTQGLPLRAFTETAEEEIVEQRDICPLNAEGEALDDLHDEEIYTIGPAELRLCHLQEKFGNGAMDRVALRALFLSGPTS